MSLEARENALVIGSGGIKGFCYLGACKEIDERVKSLGTFRTVVGCSVGSLIGVLVSCGYTPIEIFREFLTTEFEDMLTPGEFRDMIDKVGLFDKTMMRNFLVDLIERKLGRGDFTYSQFYEATGIQFHSITTDTDQTEVKVLNMITTPNCSIVDGVIASCSIPFIIQGSILDDGMVVDGAAMDPLGLKTALEFTNPGADIYCLFFANRPLAERIFVKRSFGRRGMEKTLEYWYRMEIIEPVRRKPPSDTLNKIFLHGKRIFRCFMEAMLENYIFRHDLENETSGSPRNIHLIPLPNFDSTIFCSPEMKIHMYFTGADVVGAMVIEKYLS